MRSRRRLCRFQMAPRFAPRRWRLGYKHEHTHRHRAELRKRRGCLGRFRSILESSHDHILVDVLNSGGVCVPYSILEAPISVLSCFGVVMPKSSSSACAKRRRGGEDGIYSSSPSSNLVEYPAANFSFKLWSSSLRRLRFGVLISISSSLNFGPGRSGGLTRICSSPPRP